MRGGKPVLGNGGRPIVTEYPDEKTAAYESLVKLAAAREMRGRPPTEAPAEARLLVVYPVPKSESARRRAAMLAGEIRPGKKPDSDNIEKIVFDSLNGIVWRDDAQVVEWAGRKIYGAEPRVEVSISWGHLA